MGPFPQLNLKTENDDLVPETSFMLNIPYTTDNVKYYILITDILNIPYLYKV
jgi:hypothetical protein